MIGFLQGRVHHLDEESLTLNVRGVGYELQCSQNTLQEVEGREVVQLWVYTHVREQAIELFGFSGQAERRLFLSLIKVSGIGPKMATKILSAAPLAKLIQMIDDSDVRGLVKLPKVGKKTAEQIVLALKGKLVLAEDEGASIFVARSEIVSALVNLGFRMSDVESVVEQMTPETDLQQGIREGLSALTQSP